MKLVHISDIHYQNGWYEQQGVVLSAFFKDLKSEIEDEECYLVITGDLVREGGNSSQYKGFFDQFDKKLNDIGITKDKRIVVPGNHETDREYTKANLYALESMAKNKVNETQLNTLLGSELKAHIDKKFETFSNFISSFADYNCSGKNIHGRGFDFSDGIGVYCLNSALCAFGGLNGTDGKKINDENLLAVETRNLSKWIQETNSSTKLLLLHHPIEWLCEASQSALEIIIQNHFQAVLYGHVHKPSSKYVNAGHNGVVDITAPALFTKKDETLGYSIIDATTKRIKIKYRAWNEQYSNFVLGTAFSGNNEGTKVFRLTDLEKSEIHSIALEQDSTKSYLKHLYHTSLNCYTSLPSIWTDREVGDKPETSSVDEVINIRNFNSIFDNDDDFIVTALPQFGLSSAATKIAYTFWVHKNELILVFEADDAPNHKSGLEKYIEDVLIPYAKRKNSISRVIIDGVKNDFKAVRRKVSALREILPDIPITIFQTVDDEAAIGSLSTEEDFPRYFLQQLKRSDIRNIVNQFINLPMGSNRGLEEDSTTQKIVDVFENLNLHRTPLNCIFLLKIAADQIDDSPVNRTEMIERFLFMLFSALSNLPKYSAIPDLKDSLNVLGFFCEGLIKENIFSFAKKHFFTKINGYCEKKLISIETDILFACLVNENILIRRNGNFTFRYTYWISFFAAQRMHQDENFRDYILEGRRYAKSPEIIEFYSGIDRRREDLLAVLTDDLKCLNEAFEERTKIPSNFNPYTKAKWVVSADDVEKMQDDINDVVANSAAPVEFRDALADQNFDRRRPYVQKMKEFLNDSSLYEAVQVMKSAARALRNSDHVDAEIKTELLSEILSTWEKVIQVACILAPKLAEDKQGTMDGMGFVLVGTLIEGEGQEHWERIMNVIPKNIAGYYEKDFSSKKMGPLVEHHLQNSSSSLQNYILMSQVIRNRPKGWENIITKHIKSLDKNSFFLLQAFLESRWEYKLGFVESNDLPALKEIMGIAIAKHHGAKKPNKKQVLAAGDAVVKSIENAEKKLNEE